MDEERRIQQDLDARLEARKDGVTTQYVSAERYVHYVSYLLAENKRLKHRVNRMLAAGMGKDWGDGFSDEAGYERTK